MTWLALAERLRRRGFEVNLHDLNHDGLLFYDRSEFLVRAAKINQYARQFKCDGFRSGAMYRQQQWYDAFEFSYDMSVPNVASLEPQRGGCCTVMPYFIGEILELPLTTVQDYSLFHILNDYSISLWTQQIEAIREQNGLITLLCASRLPCRARRSAGVQGVAGVSAGPASTVEDLDGSAVRGQSMVEESAADEPRA